MSKNVEMIERIIELASKRKLDLYKAEQADIDFFGSVLSEATIPVLARMFEAVYQVGVGDGANHAALECSRIRENAVRMQQSAVGQQSELDKKN